jgi:hypothetical protein
MAGSAMTKVESQMTLIQGYANSALAAANSALGNLGSLDFPVSYPTSYGAFSFTKITPTAASQPGQIVVSGAPGIDTLTVPTMPIKPTISTTTLGSILDISLPDVPVVEYPELSITVPAYSFSAPTQWAFDVSDILISDDPFIKAAIDRLEKNIKYGGTGLTAAAEDAIWARGKEREEQQLEDSTDKATSMWAKKGFSLPDGLLANSLSGLQMEWMNKQLDRARDISIKQAELEQSNLFKSLELTVNLADKLIRMLIDYETLVFRGQEATAKFANEYIDLQIKTYASKLEGYKATAQVHESLVRAQLAKVDLYKAQIEGEKIIGDVNEQTVKIYSEQLRATAIMMDAYKTEVDAMVAELSVEKAKIEANKIQFDSWAKSVDVNIAKYNGEVELFRAVSQANISTAEIENKYAEAVIRTAMAANELSVKSFEVAERSNQAKASVAMEAARGVAQSAASMASGAMAALSAHAGMTYSETQPLSEIGA